MRDRLSTPLRVLLVVVVLVALVFCRGVVFTLAERHLWTQQRP